MARARLLKPGFFTNDELAELPMAARLLFAGLWTLADRAGRLEDRPRRIKAELFPYDDIDADALLAALAERGFIVRYMANGIRYLQVTNFGKHQTPHVREPQSAIPAPDEHSASTVPAPDEHDADTELASPIHNHNHNPIPKAEAENAPARMADEPPDPPALVVVHSMSEVTEDRPYGMVAMLCEENGKEIDTLPTRWRDQQLGIAKRLLENYSIEQVRAFVRYRKTTWRGNEPFDLRKVEIEIGEWELAGSPPRAAPKANGNGRHQQIDSTPVTVFGGRADTDEARTRRAELEKIGNERAAARRAAEEAAAHGS